MPLVPAPELRARIAGILCAVGCPSPVAVRVSASLVEANLTGHDSHGVIRIPAYVRAIQEGRIQPNGEISVVEESPTTLVLDCSYNFGQVAAARAVALALAKLATSDVVVVALRRAGHIGRLGEYVALAAQQGHMALMVCNGTAQGGIVAPHGGVARALGSNPIAWALPGPDGMPVLLDYATSVCAQGKIQVAADKGAQLPEGWLLDKHGRPTRDPRAQADGGVMLPFAGHKGYALSVVIELLAGALSGAGPALLPGYQREQGVVLLVMRLDRFCAPRDFRGMVAEFSEAIKATPRAPDCDEILLPGEPEWRCKAQRERDGIPLPERTWARLGETATALGLGWDGDVG
ncbi:MAG: Ldh family oxidoreductase [Anaerolineae bacterium]|nr:Ldh family oxidoreductase [Anaerolineae bacterium]